MSLNQRIGQLLMATAVIHNLLGIILFWQPLIGIVRAGIINGIAQQYDRGMVFWFLLFGVVLWLLGHLTQQIQSQSQVVPESLGWGLFGLGCIGAAVMPVSGFWLVLPQAYLIIHTARARKPTIA